jgi:radical SAM protein
MRTDEAPLLVFWETTRACELACRHCRAAANPNPAAGELTTWEGVRLIEQLAAFRPRPPVLVLTGGDVMMRPDVLELVWMGRRARLPVALAPSVTPRLSRAALVELKRLGVTNISISLDGASARTHEGIRGIPGHFERTLDALRELATLGFTTQVNTAVMRDNVEELADVAGIVRDVGATCWEVFHLVKVGRGRAVGELSAEENEDVAHFLFEAARYGFIVRTVEAPWFRRVAAWRRTTEPTADPTREFALGPLYRRLSARLLERLGPPTDRPWAGTAGTRDGKGILFVSHAGWVYPAGFLPLPLGNVRDESPVDIYLHHPLLLAIRRGEFSGRCGVCEFRDLCGGSRARAFAASEDALGEDPGCAYVPDSRRRSGVAGDTRR